jgi:hypothetical protein
MSRTECPVKEPENAEGLMGESQSGLFFCAHRRLGCFAGYSSCSNEDVTAIGNIPDSLAALVRLGVGSC